MLFCSRQYLLFFVAVFAAYWTLPWPRVRIGLLLVASVGFYASWNTWLAAAGTGALPHALPPPSPPFAV